MKTRAEEVHEAMLAYKAQPSDQAFDRVWALMENEARMIVFSYHKWTGIPGETRDDSMQACRMAVWNALRTFDDDKGKRSPEVASFYLVRAMRMRMITLRKAALAQKSRPVNGIHLTVTAKSGEEDFECPMELASPERVESFWGVDEERGALIRMMIDKKMFAELERAFLESFAVDDDTGEYGEATARSMREAGFPDATAKTVDNAINRVKARVKEFLRDHPWLTECQGLRMSSCRVGPTRSRNGPPKGGKASRTRLGKAKSRPPARTSTSS